MKNWKSTATGILTGTFMLVGPHLVDNKKPVISWEYFLPALGVMGLGATTKDADVHSTLGDMKQATDKVLDSGSETAVVKEVAKQEDTKQ